MAGWPLSIIVLVLLKPDTHDAGQHPQKSVDGPFRELKACVNPKPTDTFYFVQTPEARVGVAQICELYARRFTIVDIVCGKIKDLGGLTHQYAQLERG